jgi:hypothetical protein
VRLKGDGHGLYPIAGGEGSRIPLVKEGSVRGYNAGPLAVLLSSHVGAMR